jgi:SAM-dependent methyltransferase
MGLLAPVAEFLLAEHRYRPIKGDVLFVGRQTTFLREASLDFLLNKYGVKTPRPSEVEFDAQTVGSSEGRFITDRYFMKCLGVERLRFIDVSDYEGADIVADLGYPIDPALHGKFDFIYNGGCFDNMFNPGQAMMNLSSMLKPGGRVVCMESAGSYNSPYLMYSPGWFFDYYATNGFSDCKVYVCSYRDTPQLFFGAWDVFWFDWRLSKNGPSPEAKYNNHLLLLTIAEKGAHSSADRQPIQFQYRHDAQLNAAIEKTVAAFNASPRPILNGLAVPAEAAPQPGRLARISDRLGITLYRTEPYLRPVGKLGLNLRGAQ